MKANFLYLILFLTILFISISEISCETKKKKHKKKYTREDSVIVLTPKNFDQTIKSIDILVFFYSPGCKMCEQFLPTFNLASMSLRHNKPKLNFGKIELEDTPKIKEKYQLINFPAVKYYKKGVGYNYSGTTEVESLIKFMWKNNLPPVSELMTLAEISSFKNAHEITVIYFGNNKQILKDINDYAFEDADIFYANADFEMAYKTYGVKKNTIILYKKNGDERTEISGKLTKDGIINFIKKNSIDKILEANERTGRLIWGLRNPGLFLFINYNDEKSNYLRRIFNEVSEKLAGRLKVIVMGLESPMEKKINTQTLVNPQDLPTIRIYDPRKGPHAFYLFNKRLEMNVKNIMEFVEKFESGRLQFYKLSEEIPKVQRGFLREIVGITFDKEVFYNHQHVIIVFYHPYKAPLFQNAINFLENFAKKVKEDKISIYSDKEKNREGKLFNERVLINKKLNFGKLDLNRNDPDMRIEYEPLPSIHLFLDEDKNHPFRFNGDLTDESFIAFLEEHFLTKDKDKKDNDDEEDKNKSDL